MNTAETCVKNSSQLATQYRRKLSLSDYMIRGARLLTFHGKYQVECDMKAEVYKRRATIKNVSD